MRQPLPDEEPSQPPVKLPCDANSFSADTPVATAHGLRPISTIHEGDQVFAYNAQTGVTGLFTVTDVLVHLDPAQLHLTIDTEPIETTPEHPFFTRERGWVDAGDLRRGEHVRRQSGIYGVVQALWVETEPQVMYNLTVAQAHTFFVGGGRWLVHNSGCTSFLEELKRRIAHWWEYTVRKNRSLSFDELIPNDGRYGISADDAFNPQVGPSERAINRHIQYFLQHGRFDDTERMVAFDTHEQLGGYVLLNGHHRWIAAQRLRSQGVNIPDFKVEVIPWEQ